MIRRFFEKVTSRLEKCQPDQDNDKSGRRRDSAMSSLGDSADSNSFRIDYKERKNSTCSAISLESGITGVASNSSHSFVHHGMPPIKASSGLSIDTGTRTNNCNGRKQKKTRFLHCKDPAMLSKFVEENARRHFNLTRLSQQPNADVKHPSARKPIRLTDKMLVYDKALSVTAIVAEDRRRLAAVDPRALLGWQILLLINDHEYLACAVVTDVRVPRLLGVAVGKPIFQLRIDEYCETWTWLKTTATADAAADADAGRISRKTRTRFSFRRSSSNRVAPLGVGEDSQAQDGDNTTTHEDDNSDGSKQGTAAAAAADSQHHRVALSEGVQFLPLRPVLNF